ncbi:MAG: HNH endonuclease [Bacillota bacterium]|nr:HNH endonuclease [Bacillota bacterium]
MKPRTREKLYIYYREGKKCFYCRKKLLYKQMSIDHFYPLSSGGTHDIFNIVCSCKKCNELKEDKIIENHKEIILELFLKAVEDNFIIGENLDISNKELKSLLLESKRVKNISGEFIFESWDCRFYMKDSKVYKYNYVSSII